MKNSLFLLTFLLFNYATAATFADAIANLEESMCPFLAKSRESLERDTKDYKTDPSEKNRQWLLASENHFAYTNSGCSLAKTMAQFLVGNQINAAQACNYFYESIVNLSSAIPKLTIFDEESQLSPLRTMAQEGVGIHANICISAYDTDERVKAHWRKLVSR